MYSHISRILSDNTYLKLGIPCQDNEQDNRNSVQDDILMGSQGNQCNHGASGHLVDGVPRQGSNILETGDEVKTQGVQIL